jgi:hypothetical protein
MKKSENKEENTGTERTERVKERKRRRHDTTKPATGHKFKKEKKPISLTWLFNSSC